MPEYKKVKTFIHGGNALLRVASVSYDPVVAQFIPIPDGAGDVTFTTVKSAPVQGVVVFRDKAQAETMADVPENVTPKSMSFKVETELDADKTITFTNVVTGAARGNNFALGGSGPWTVPFGAASVSEPT